MVSRTNKFRGSRTHGRGKKSGRGAGIHGGRGNAGLHKHKFMHMLKYDPGHFGPRGFKRPLKMLEEKRAITTGVLESVLPRLVSGGFAKEQDGKITVDLAAAGYDKLISDGSIHSAIHVTVAAATPKAKQHIEKSGGSVTLK
ncbi:MAG: 50S ribosomal protein L15 [Candidatus Thermoplasmatota archaeon]|nr:50S ribosomal protein L15 [Candidatus Thermoplasmatota archaeon]